MTSFEHLWAPWRAGYVQNAKSLAAEGCLFCNLTSTESPRDHLRVYCTDEVLVVLNLFPYSTGHTLVAPCGHWASPTEAPDEVLTSFYRMVVYTERVLRRIYRCDGLNVGMNLGESAGAGIPTHFHMHLVPRWVGDTNFMTAFSATRVHPVSLQESMDRMQPYYEQGTLPADHPLFAPDETQEAT